MADDFEAFTAEIARKAAEFGRAEAERAAGMSNAWAAWSNRLHALVAEMPQKGTGLPPRYLDTDGESNDIRLRVDHIDQYRMREVLERTVTQADAISVAWSRAVPEVERRTAATRAELAPAVETCDACETTGQNCARHSGPQWRAAAEGGESLG